MATDTAPTQLPPSVPVPSKRKVRVAAQPGFMGITVGVPLPSVRVAIGLPPT